MPHNRKQNSLLIIALFMVSVNPVITLAEEKIHPGKANFEDLCASCHGYDGIPVFPGTPNFAVGERLDKKDNELLEAIRKGKGDVMPPWEDMLNELAQREVLNYIKDVMHKKSSDNNK